MKQSSLDFLSLFFNPDEEICVSDSQFAYHSISQESLNGKITLISPNKKAEDNIITEEDINLISINPIKGFRNDENVTAFRSFLVEVDFGTVQEQMLYINSLGLPYSYCCFSGGKSLHFGIVLETDLPSEDEWRRVAEWILSIVSKADQKTKNPSRCIRFPNNMRKDSKKLLQKQISLKNRIPNSDIYAFLNRYPDLDPLKKQIAVESTVTKTIEGVPTWILNKLAKGIDESRGRNNEWFSISMGLAVAGFDFNSIIELLNKYFIPDRDFKRKEWQGIIKSAVKKARTKAS